MTAEAELCRLLDEIRDRIVGGSLAYVESIYERLYCTCQRFVLEAPEADDDVLRQLAELIDNLRTCIDDVETETTLYRCPLNVTGSRGRPAFSIDSAQLEWFFNFGFAYNDIAQILCVSPRTIYRRASELNLSKRSFTYITDDDLDSAVRQIQGENVNIGERMMQGYLQSSGIVVQRERLRYGNEFTFL